MDRPYTGKCFRHGSENKERRLLATRNECLAAAAQAKERRQRGANDAAASPDDVDGSKKEELSMPAHPLHVQRKAIYSEEK